MNFDCQSVTKFPSFLIWTAGVNDAEEQAIELAELLREWARGSHVNLIPFNPIDGSNYRRPYKKAVSGQFRHLSWLIFIKFYIFLAKCLVYSSDIFCEGSGICKCFGVS